VPHDERNVHRRLRHHDLVIDVTATSLEHAGGTYHALTPARLLDSRYGNGLSGKFLANVPRTLIVATRGGVPANAKAITAT